MSPKTRPAQPADLDAICAIAGDSRFSARWTRSQYQEEIGKKDSCLAVCGDAHIAGYILVRRVFAESQILDMAVRPEDQGRGLGRALLEYAEAQARAWGCGKLALEVSAGNHTAQRLYARCGFQVVGRRRKFYNDASDAILMDRILS